MTSKMSSPISILEEKYYLCNEIKNKIQTFLKNDVAYDALREYFIYLAKKKDLYQKFCEYQYNIKTDYLYSYKYRYILVFQVFSKLRITRFSESINKVVSTGDFCFYLAAH